ncbi:hypothetical protein HCN44_006618 [Aphidius gifuensis]|uniref:Protein kinase domain-containing protein n=1 Tax=Aphidius gifuensis TaxID=684658 RepID=A0A834Y056_APHGI|nr:hypothetical protein HCN44_006618 [Aphidius gifuensis]
MDFNKKKYVAAFNFPYSTNVSENYEKIIKIGQGTYGKVFKAKDKKDGKFVAIKKIMTENETEGFPITALREIQILKLLKHDNVVNLIEVCYKPGSKKLLKNYLIMEFCEHDLAGLLSNKNVKFNLGEIKKIMQQMLNGLFFIHTSKVLHRDMKASNILITKNGTLKLADFGLSRAFSTATSSSNSNRYTNGVVTLWYRPPELLLGEKNYGTSIDLWGVGCIMAEMWTRMPILQGKTEQEQLIIISKFCGSITTDVWPSVVDLELFNRIQLPRGQQRRVVEKLKPFVKDEYACDLIDKLLALDPNTRLDTDSALNHDFFWTDPMPCDLGNMMAQHTQSMFSSITPPGQRHHQVPGGHLKRNHLLTDSGYQDRIY